LEARAANLLQPENLPWSCAFQDPSPRDGRGRRRPSRMPGNGKTPVVATRLNLKNRSDGL
jgi:hypothetical protein